MEHACRIKGLLWQTYARGRFDLQRLSGAVATDDALGFGTETNFVDVLGARILIRAIMAVNKKFGTETYRPAVHSPLRSWIAAQPGWPPRELL